MKLAIPDWSSFLALRSLQKHFVVLLNPNPNTNINPKVLWLSNKYSVQYVSWTSLCDILLHLFRLWRVGGPHFFGSKHSSLLLLSLLFFTQFLSFVAVLLSEWAKIRTALQTSRESDIKRPLDRLAEEKPAFDINLALTAGDNLQEIHGRAALRIRSWAGHRTVQRGQWWWRIRHSYPVSAHKGYTGSLERPSRSSS